MANKPVNGFLQGDARTELKALLDRLHTGGTNGRHVVLKVDTIEISHGEWEGQLASAIEISHAEMFGTWRSRPDRDVPAGPDAETLGDVEERAWPVLVRTCARLAADETALLVAHDAVNRVLLCRVLVPTTACGRLPSPASLNVLSGSRSQICRSCV
jgi:probable phosphoglycerate mutase